MEPAMKLGEARANPDAIPSEDTEAWQYLSRLTQRIDPRFDMIEMRSFMSDGRIIADKGQVNRIAFELRDEFSKEVDTSWIEKCTQLLETNKEKILQSSLLHLDSKIRQAGTRLREAESNHESYVNLMRNCRRDLFQKITDLDTLTMMKETGKTSDADYLEIAKIVASGAWQLLKISEDGQLLTFAPTTGIIQTQFNPAAGLDLNVNFGVILFQLDLGSKMISAKPGIGCIFKDRYYHTHISREGEICWGDSYEPVLALMGRGQYSECFNTLLALMSTYCPDNPYVSLSRMAEAQGVASSYKMGRQDRIDRKELHVIPANVPELHNSEPEWDARSRIHIGQLVKVRGCFDRGQNENYMGMVGYVTNSARNPSDCSQLDDPLNRLYEVRILRARLDGSVRSLNYASINCTRDELEPLLEKSDNPTAQQWYHARRIFHENGFLFFGDKVQITSVHNSGGESNKGRIGRVCDMQGTEGYFNWEALTNNSLSTDGVNGHHSIRLGLFKINSNGTIPNMARHSCQYSELMPLDMPDEFIALWDEKIDCINSMNVTHRTRGELGCDIYEIHKKGLELQAANAGTTPTVDPSSEYSECPECDGIAISYDSSEEYPWWCEDCEQSWEGESEPESLSTPPLETPVHVNFTSVSDSSVPTTEISF